MSYERISTKCYLCLKFLNFLAGELEWYPGRSRVRIQTVPGVSVYYVIVTGYYGQSGTYQLSWQYALLPSSSPTTTASPSASISLGASISNTATGSLTASGTFSARPTPSSTATRKLNAFQRDSLVLLRVGSSASSGATNPGMALPIFLDEFQPGSANQTGPMQSLPLPTTSTDAYSGCTLSYGTSTAWLWEQEGMPHTTTNGDGVVFPCWSTGAGSSLSAADDKTVAILRSDGSIDTTTSFGNMATSGNATYPQALRTAFGVSASGAGGFWVVTSGVNYTKKGLLNVAYGDSNAVQFLGAYQGFPGFTDLRSLAITLFNSVYAMYATTTAADGAATAGMFQLWDSATQVGSP